MDDIRDSATHGVVGQLLNQDGGMPLVGFTVHAFDLDAGTEPEDLGSELTDRDGRFAITYSAPQILPEQEGTRAGRRLGLRILDPGGNEIYQIEVHVEIGTDRVLEVNVPAMKKPSEPALTELVESLRLNLPPTFLPKLAKEGISTLADIRRAGGLSQISDLPLPADNAEVRKLEAYADLSRLVPSGYVNTVLIEKAFASVSAIANTPLADFIAAVREDLGDIQATQLHTVARIQTDYLNNILVALRADAANGFTPAFDGLISDSVRQQLISDECGCKDCKSALNPPAYLAALLDYAVKHLFGRDPNRPPVLEFLTKTFHQPFGDLPTACDLVERQVRQVRICIEVLRGYLKGLNLTPSQQSALQEAEQDYRFKAYRELLVRLGTSYGEMRLIRTAKPVERKALAENRLGIDLGAPDEDHLNMLLLDPDAPAGQPNAITERVLERLFGLADTTHDPLSEGAKQGDTQPQEQVPRWRLDGAEWGVSPWGSNTDLDGNVYLSLANYSASKYEVDIFRDAKRTSPVGSGALTAPTGTTTIAEQNSSGLSGILDIDYTADTHTITLSVVPTFLTWRFLRLRTLWHAQDWPTDRHATVPSDAYTAADLLPIIDPDIVGPDDFRSPSVKATPGDPDRAFDIWLKRRNWVDGRLQAFSGMKKDVGGQQIPDLDAMLDAMNQPVQYGGATVVQRTWEASTQPKDFDGLLNTLAKGNDAAVIEEAKRRILRDLNLTVESFIRLMALRAKDRQARSGPQNEQVSADEWREVYSILTEAQKGRVFPAWRKEESGVHILFGPTAFWISLSEPTEGDWPPVVTAQRPLIDPEELKLSDLPDPVAGRQAIALWETRCAHLEQIRGNIKAAREGGGFDAMLVETLGQPQPGHTWLQDLKALKNKSSSSNPADVAAATATITSDLQMTVGSFNRLMAIEVKSENANPLQSPTSAEWAEVYSLLTSVHKRRREFTAWLLEEQNAVPSIVYWTACKAKLPRWRATPEARQGWSQALRRRSSPPLIDPNLLSAGHLKSVTWGAPAFGLWFARNTWIDTQRKALKASREGDADGLTGLETIVQQSVNVSLADLVALNDTRIQNGKFAARLDQLSLDPGAFAYLLHIRDLLNGNTTVLTSEWDNVYAILVQVEKRRAFAQWRQEEMDENITLGPDYFRIPSLDTAVFPPPPPVELPVWLATQDQLRSWEDTLQSRIDQQQSAVDALREAVSATEEATLPLLRDALVLATDAQGSTSEKRGKWLADRLLIDINTSGCQMITRVTQAIQTMQAILEKYQRYGFEEDWKWLGSYNSWRAAQTVFLYPENILQPGLRTKQTPAFSTMVDGFRSLPALTAGQARSEASAYFDYYRDVSSLHVQATVDLQAGSYTFYMFAWAEQSGRVYWSSTYTAYPVAEQYPWKLVRGLDSVLNIIGAGLGTRFIYLFAHLDNQGRQNLVFTKYDLAKGAWDEAPTQLKLPANATTFSAATKQSNDFNQRPHLVIFANGRFYERKFRGDGTDQADEPWNDLDGSAIDVRDISGMIEVAGDWHLFGRSNAGAVVRILPPGRRPDGSWTQWGTGDVAYPDSSTGEFRGVFSLPDKPDVFVFWGEGASTKYRVISNVWGTVADASVNRVAPCYGYTFSANPSRQVAHHIDAGQVGAYRCYFNRTGDSLSEDQRTRVAPYVPDPGPIEQQGTAIQLPRSEMEAAYAFNADGPASTLAYLEEAYYFVAMQLALQFQQQGEYVTTLDWFRTVYDYTLPSVQRSIYPGFEKDDVPGWIGDPYDPHSIAANRPRAYVRYTLLALIRCFLDYADAEFTRDTVESVERARKLYEKALELLDEPPLQQKPGTCQYLVGNLDMEVRASRAIPTTWMPAWYELKQVLTGIDDSTKLKTVIGNVGSILLGRDDVPWATRFSSARKFVTEARSAISSPTSFKTALDENSASISRAHTLLFSQPQIAGTAERITGMTATHFMYNIAVSGAPQNGRTQPITATSSPMSAVISGRAPSRGIAQIASGAGASISLPLYQFCTPPNQVIASFHLRAELNYYKLHTCRNIVGIQRQLELNDSTTDIRLPAIGTDGQIALPGAAVLRPAAYRYSVLIERAKQLVGLAQQVESSFLSTLEKRDAENYSLLKARQDARLAQASVQLQELRIAEANDGVQLAQLQQARADIQQKTYTKWLDAGPNDYENKMLNLQTEAAFARLTGRQASDFAQGLSGFVTNPIGAVLGTAINLTWGEGAYWQEVTAERGAQEASFWASHERRKDEWKLQESLAQQDYAIGARQIAIAQDNVRVVGQERTIAEIQAQQGEIIADFLANKFTNAELYDWMSSILERVYRFFLQQATAMARLASDQLAFERHEVLPTFIHADYWIAPSTRGTSSNTGGGSGSTNEATDRRGLTGSARLLQDIYQLDQYAFESDKRKLQLTKVISLSRLDPYAFQLFRETGTMAFATSMNLFDRDFPGHYLRLIRRVRTSVIALIPPTQGIHATLSTNGISRVVVGGDMFQTIVVRRDPESVALTGSINASGLFELETQAVLALPFEWLGVDTTWEFSMPRAANSFAYRTIADVLITIEYTALNSFGYRQQVIRQLDRNLSADHSSSFRNQFADQWYDLHNPDQTQTPMAVRFSTLREDFPPNLENLRIAQVLLYFARVGGSAFEIPVDYLRFTEQGGQGTVGGGATSIDGVISTRRGNAGSWTAMIGKSPIGEWELALPNMEEMRNRLKYEEIEDILFIITYTGQVPEWPM